MNEDKLKTWGDDKPDKGCFIALYPEDKDHAIFCRVVQSGFFRGVKIPSIQEEIIPSDQDSWLEVPAPPDWNKVMNKRRALQILEKIAALRAEIEALEEESRKLAEEMKENP